MADAAAVHLPSGLHIGLQSSLDGAGQRARLHLNAFETGQEGGMAAVVGPIGVDHTQLGDSRVAPLLVPEIPLAEQEILRRHGEAHALPISLHLFRLHGDKSSHPRHIGGTGGGHIQGLGLVKGGQPGFHRIDQILLDPLHIRRRQLPFQADHPGGEHPGPFPLGEELNTLGGRIRPLVVLAGQILHGENLPTRLEGQGLVIYHIGVWFGKDGPPRPREFAGGEPLNIVSVEDAQGAQLGHPQVIPQIREHLPRLDIEPLPLFHKYANHICHCRLLISIVFSLIAANGSCHILRL